MIINNKDKWGFNIKILIMLRVDICTIPSIENTLIREEKHVCSCFLTFVKA